MTEEELAAVKGRGWEEYKISWTDTRSITDTHLVSTTDHALVWRQVVSGHIVPASAPDIRLGIPTADASGSQSAEFSLNKYNCWEFAEWRG